MALYQKHPERAHVKKSNVELGKDGSIINYQYLDFPFPIGDRYYKLRIINSKENIDKGKFFRSSWTYIKGSGNIENTYGSWMLKEYGQEKTLATYVVCTDPGGRIPKWAQNMATKISLPKIMGRVRQQKIPSTGTSKDRGLKIGITS